MNTEMLLMSAGFGLF